MKGPKRPSKMFRLKRKLIRDRGMNCYWCNRETSLLISPDADLYCTLEHLIRVADGGKTEWDNCTIACRKCNNTRHHHLSLSRRKRTVLGKYVKLYVKIKTPPV